MRFIHLADLHIGKRVNGFLLIDEQKYILNKILNNIAKHKPDVIIIAGDIYDRYVPSSSAIELFDDFFTSLAETSIPVLIIAGNHDAPERLTFAKRILTKQNIHLAGKYQFPLAPLTLTDEYGEVDFWLLPFFYPSEVQLFFEKRTITTYEEALLAILETAPINYERRNILIAHQFFTASEYAPIRSESEIDPIGGLDAININSIALFDYVALGHLHRPQSVGTKHIRYAGSPLKYSLSELNAEKSLLLGELKRKNQLEVTKLPLIPLNDLQKITGTLKELLRPEFYTNFNCQNYFHIILTDKEPVFEPLGHLRSVYPKIMSLNFATDNNELKDTELIKENCHLLEALSPYELFKTFYNEMSELPLSEAQEQLVISLLTELETTLCD